MEKFFPSNVRLGIIAGGQLAKMLIQEASKWDLITYVMDSDENCPAANIASKYVKGSHLEFEDVYKFGKLVDILTFEIESVNVEALKRLKAEGLRIAPDPSILELIQDKGSQKEFYHENEIPTSPFKLFNNDKQIWDAIEKGEIKFPFVQKLRKGGYDGRGVAVINHKDDLHKIFPDPSVVEEKVDIVKEISTIVARNGKGEVKCYPTVEMVFDPRANLVDKLICPSSIPTELSGKAANFATKIINLLNIEGLLAVEFFVASSGQIVVNEMAPRAHNSGHHTIESIITSQFEQHLRAILNLPLGSTELKLPAVMINILGEEGYEGTVFYQGLTESMAIDGVKVHLYGKGITKPYRKMGHVTILSSTVECALEKAEKVKQLIKAKSWEKR